MEDAEYKIPQEFATPSSDVATISKKRTIGILIVFILVIVISLFGYFSFYKHTSFSSLLHIDQKVETQPVSKQVVNATTTDSVGKSKDLITVVFSTTTILARTMDALMREDESELFEGMTPLPYFFLKEIPTLFPSGKVAYFIGDNDTKSLFYDDAHIVDFHPYRGTGSETFKLWGEGPKGLLYSNFIKEENSIEETITYGSTTGNFVERIDAMIPLEDSFALRSYEDEWFGDGSKTDEMHIYTNWNKVATFTMGDYSNYDYSLRYGEMSLANVGGKVAYIVDDVAQKTHILFVGTEKIAEGKSIQLFNTQSGKLNYLLKDFGKIIAKDTPFPYDHEIEKTVVDGKEYSRTETDGISQTMTTSAKIGNDDIRLITNKRGTSTLIVNGVDVVTNSYINFFRDADTWGYLVNDMNTKSSKIVYKGAEYESNALFPEYGVQIIQGNVVGMGFVKDEKKIGLYINGKKVAETDSMPGTGHESASPPISYFQNIGGKIGFVTYDKTTDKFILYVDEKQILEGFSTIQFVYNSNGEVAYILTVSTEAERDNVKVYKVEH